MGLQKTRDLGVAFYLKVYISGITVTFTASSNVPWCWPHIHCFSIFKHWAQWVLVKTRQRTAPFCNADDGCILKQLIAKMPLEGVKHGAPCVQVRVRTQYGNCHGQIA